MHDAGIAESFNGHFAFTIDGNPLLGPSSFVDGLWLAEALWVTHAARGRARSPTSCWAATRASSSPPRPPGPLPAAPCRAALRAGARRAAVRRGIHVLHPAQPLLHPRGLRTVPYHQRFEELGAQLTESAGWERALWFASNAALPEPSHRQTRDDWSSLFWSEIVDASTTPRAPPPACST